MEDVRRPLLRRVVAVTHVTNISNVLYRQLRMDSEIYLHYQWFATVQKSIHVISASFSVILLFSTSQFCSRDTAYANPHMLDGYSYITSADLWRQSASDIYRTNRVVNVRRDQQVAFCSASPRHAELLDGTRGRSLSPRELSEPESQYKSPSLYH